MEKLGSVGAMWGKCCQLMIPGLNKAKKEPMLFNLVKTGRLNWGDVG